MADGQTTNAPPVPTATVDSGVIAPVVPDHGSRQGVTIGVEYGNPYDRDAPPYSVYRDPVGDAMRMHEAEAEAEAKRHASAKGTEYRFDGHESPYEGTSILKTANGSAHVGGTVKLSQAEAKSLADAGFKLTKVGADKPEKDDK